ncbi:MAG TPA: membrane dipeptidase [Thermoanaerobaculia bacterium]|nr:membrane dipeptidase [Thermoanaerobaculia bacterium]
MRRRTFLRDGLLTGLGALCGPLLNLGRCRLDALQSVQVSTRAVDLVLRSTVVDMLCLLTLDWPRLFSWQREPDRFALGEFRELESLGVDIFHPAVETGARDPRDGVERWLRGWRRLLGSQPCYLQPVETVTDLLQAPRLGKIGVIVGFQNASHFQSAEDVAHFHAGGQRVAQLTYNAANRLGSGCLAPRDGGLTPLGAEVVAEMNRRGMAVDVSHCGERTSLEAIEASVRPVLVTHSNCAALSPGQPRCKSDRVLRAMATKGGVIGITLVRPFVKPSGAATLADLLDHFDHVTRLVGVEHVGLGSDVDVAAVDPATGRPHPLYAIRGLDPRARVFQIADGLLARGYSEEDVELVLGGNFLRALTAIWPDDSWELLSERELRRDPFCPAAWPRGPAGPEPRGPATQ